MTIKLNLETYMNQIPLPYISQSPLNPTPALPEAINPQSHHASTPEPSTPESISPAEDRPNQTFPKLSQYEFEICKFILNQVHDGMNKLEFAPYYALDPNFTIVMVPNHMAALRRAIKKF